MAQVIINELDEIREEYRRSRRTVITQASEAVFDQASLRHGSVLGTAQDLDDQVDHVAGLDQSFLYLLHPHRHRTAQRCGRGEF